MSLILIVVFTLFYSNGVLTQLHCMKYDFNNSDTANYFQDCNSYGCSQFESYANSSVEPYRNDVDYYITNVDTKYLYLRTKDTFIMDNYTEIYAAVYLNSKVADANIMFAVRFFDIYNQYSFAVIRGPHDEWIEYHSKGYNHPRNVTLEIRVDVSQYSTLAIEYLHIVNPRKAEAECRRTPPDIRTTTTTLSTTPSTTETSTPSTTETTTPSTTETTTPSTTETTTPSTTEITLPSTTEVSYPPTTEVTWTTEQRDCNTTETRTTPKEMETEAPLPSNQKQPKPIPIINNIYNFIANFNFTYKITN